MGQRTKQAQVFFMGGTEDRRQPGGDRRRRGRPPAQELGSSLSAWVPVSLHDRLIKAAIEREVSVSELVREALAVTLQKPKL